MHELSIADAIVRIACANAGGRRIVRVEVKVGHLRQVVPDALAFAFELVAQGTAADGAELVLVEVPPASRCRPCGARTQAAGFPLACGTCGSLDVELLQGEELLVDALELDDEPISMSSPGGQADGH
jgi:hydrogenase nickel incorporation protein HypA/HybF